jgi:hypothetical protein
VEKDSTDLSSVSNVVCKAYPETDSPFNFSDKYQYEMCASDDIGKTEIGSSIPKDTKCAKDKDGKYYSLSGGSITYEQFKALSVF